MAIKPPTTQSDKRELRFEIRISPNDRRVLIALAAAEQRTLAETIRVAIAERAARLKL